MALTPVGFPVRTHETSIHVDGNDQGAATVITSLYADQIMFVVTQLGTLGTIVHAQKETVLGGGTTFSTATLLGARDDPLPELCARQLIERTSQSGCNLPILLCLGLKRGVGRDVGQQRQLINSIVAGCLENPLWQK